MIFRFDSSYFTGLLVPLVYPLTQRQWGRSNECHHHGVHQRSKRLQYSYDIMDSAVYLFLIVFTELNEIILGNLGTPI